MNTYYKIAQFAAAVIILLCGASCILNAGRVLELEVGEIIACFIAGLIIISGCMGLVKEAYRELTND